MGCQLLSLLLEQRMFHMYNCNAVEASCNMLAAHVQSTCCEA